MLAWLVIFIFALVGIDVLPAQAALSGSAIYQSNSEAIVLVHVRTEHGAEQTRTRFIVDPNGVFAIVLHL